MHALTLNMYMHQEQVFDPHIFNMTPIKFLFIISLASVWS